MGVDNPESTSPDDSTEQNTDAVIEDTSETGSDPESSTGSEGEKFDLLSVVREATQSEEDTASPAGQEESDPESSSEASETKENASADDADPDSFSDVPFHTHPRFKELVQQRDRYREGAQNYEQVQDFLQTNGITPEEAADQLTLLAQMKTDPAGAWEKMKPMVQQLLIDAGQVLDADLTAQVNSGKITREAALEISRLRAQQASSAKAREHEQKVQEQTERTQAVRATQTSVAEWERSTRAKDPDFDAKSQDLRKELLWIHSQEGVADTPEKAKDQVERAYEAVNKHLAKAKPPKPAIVPVTGGRVASGNQTSEPTSMLDIVKSARAAG